MCSSTTCGVCGKTTWSGCGRHVDQVRARVPEGDWCEAHALAGEPAVKSTSGLFRIFSR